MDWPITRLRDIAQEFVSGGTPSTKVDRYWTGDIPWITGADINDKIVLVGRKWITQEAIENSATHVVPKGAILLVTRTGVGKVAKAGADIAISQDLTGIVLTERAHPDFVVAAIQQKTNSLLDIQQGATIKGILRKDVEKIEIPLPPLSEQRRIVEILEQADRLRHLGAEADAKENRIIPALFIRMFGNPSSNPMGWETGSLGEAIVETQYGISKRANTDGRGVLMLRMNNISSSGNINLAEVKHVDLEPTELKQKLLQPGDILFNRTNSIELVGKTGLWMEPQLPAVAASYLIRVRVNDNKVTPTYIWALMNTPHMKNVLAMRARRAAGMANLNATELRKLPGMFPPLQRQKEFSNLTNSIRQTNIHRHRFQTDIGRLFPNLLNRAFAGTLTASWRDANMFSLHDKMEQQARSMDRMMTS